MSRIREEDFPDFMSVFGEEVLSWPQVTSKFMFGCLAYLAKGKLFAFVQNESIVLTCIDDEAREELTAGHEAFAFESSGKTVGGWLQVVISDESELTDILPYVRKSYEAAFAKPASKKKKKR